MILLLARTEGSNNNFIEELLLIFSPSFVGMDMVPVGEASIGAIAQGSNSLIS